MGEELERPGNLRDDVIFRKIGMDEGVETALDDKLLKDSVEWIRRVWSSQDRPPTKITRAHRKHLLIYSRSDVFSSNIQGRPKAPPPTQNASQKSSGKQKSGS